MYVCGNLQKKLLVLPGDKSIKKKIKSNKKKILPN